MIVSISQVSNHAVLSDHDKYEHHDSSTWEVRTHGYPSPKEWTIPRWGSLAQIA